VFVLFDFFMLLLLRTRGARLPSPRDATTRRGSSRRPLASRSTPTFALVEDQERVHLAGDVLAVLLEQAQLNGA
jgi:hypothetical protein